MTSKNFRNKTKNTIRPPKDSTRILSSEELKKCKKDNGWICLCSAQTYTQKQMRKLLGYSQIKE